MKAILAAAVIMAGSAAYAGERMPTQTVVDDEASAFLGLTWTFGAGGSGAGIGLKVLSTNKRDSGAVAAGVTYNFDGSIGCDLGAAYNFDDATVTATYDICKRAPQIGIGGTKKPDTREVMIEPET